MSSQITLEQFHAAADAYQRAVGDADEVPPERRGPAVVKAEDRYHDLLILADRAGLEKPPVREYETDGQWRQEWRDWWHGWRRWRAVAQDRLSRPPATDREKIRQVLWNQLMFPKDIAGKFRVPLAALRARLDRFRDTSDQGYLTVEGRGVRTEKYQYRLSSVWHIVNELSVDVP
jgi:hypothetical protein